MKQIFGFIVDGERAVLEDIEGIEGVAKNTCRYYYLDRKNESITFHDYVDSTQNMIEIWSREYKFTNLVKYTTIKRALDWLGGRKTSDIELLI